MGSHLRPTLLGVSSASNPRRGVSAFDSTAVNILDLLLRFRRVFDALHRAFVMRRSSFEVFETSDSGATIFFRNRGTVLHKAHVDTGDWRHRPLFYTAQSARYVALTSCFVGFSHQQDSPRPFPVITVVALAVPAARLPPPLFITSHIPVPAVPSAPAISAFMGGGGASAARLPFLVLVSSRGGSIADRTAALSPSIVLSERKA